MRPGDEIARPKEGKPILILLKTLQDLFVIDANECFRLTYTFAD